MKLECFVESNRTIAFHLCICGMSDELFSEKIMIYKPFRDVVESISFQECVEKNLLSLGDVVGYVVQKSDTISTEVLRHGLSIGLGSVYVLYDGYLLRPRCEKQLVEMFDYLATDRIDIYYIYVAGGASLHYHGFSFTVHSNEDIHKETPHVHVGDDDNDTRYSLESFQRYEDDKTNRHILKSEKKIIIPFIKKHQNELMRLWNLNVHGYDTPLLDINLNQFYPES